MSFRFAPERIFEPLSAEVVADTELWTDPNGRRLSDRVWLARQSVRQQIDDRVRLALVNGESPISLAGALEQYLSPSWAPKRNEQGRLEANQPKQIVTRTPSAGAGSTAARRLARTEISRAFEQAGMRASLLNPFVDRRKYNLSGGRPESDECDSRAQRSSRGEEPGVYDLRDFPSPPTHPNCKCYGSPVTVKDPDAVIEQLRVEALGAESQGQFDIAGYTRSEVDAMRSALNSSGATDLGGRIAPDWTYGGSTGRYTFEEAAALRDYKASWYGQLNKYLRAGDYASARVTAPEARLTGLRDALDSAFDKADPLTEPIRVARGSFVDFIGIEDQRPGTIFVDDGFISTSVKQEGAGFGRELQMEIYVPEGSKVLAMDPIERGATTGEGEVLLRRGTRFLIREVRPDERRVIVEVLP